MHGAITANHERIDAEAAGSVIGGAFSEFDVDELIEDVPEPVFKDVPLGHHVQSTKH